MRNGAGHIRVTWKRRNGAFVPLFWGMGAVVLECVANFYYKPVDYQRRMILFVAVENLDGVVFLQYLCSGF